MSRTPTQPNIAGYHGRISGTGASLISTKRPPPPGQLCGFLSLLSAQVGLDLPRLKRLGSRVPLELFEDPTTHALLRRILFLLNILHGDLCGTSCGASAASSEGKTTATCSTGQGMPIARRPSRIVRRYSTSSATHTTTW